MCRETPLQRGFVQACSNRFFGWACVGMCGLRRGKKVGRLLAFMSESFPAWYFGGGGGGRK